MIKNHTKSWRYARKLKQDQSNIRYFSYLKSSSSCYCLRISNFSMFMHQILRCGVFSLATYILSYCHLAQKVVQACYGIFLCAIYKSETDFQI